MLVYSSNTGPRLRYVATLILKEVGFTNISFSSDPSVFEDYKAPLINYSDSRKTANDVWINPYGLLEEQGIREQQIKVFEFQHTPVFFGVSGGFPFDIFSASFYLISRYEEYLPHQKDMYGRYAVENSLAFRNSFLHRPLINEWISLFRKFLITKFPSLEFSLAKPSFEAKYTYDIDEAFSHLYKSTWRRVGSSLKNMVQGKWEMLRERRMVRNRQMQDPFDSFAWMDELHTSSKISPCFFLLVAKQNGKYDKNILPSVPAIKKLFGSLARKYEVGLHPSWQSGDDARLLNEEKAILSEITGRDIFRSRQHFIRFSLPDTYRQLMQAGIKEDYSMGYGSANGFRASAAFPFLWFNLQNNEATSLTIFPFCFMDANSFFESKKSAVEAIEEMNYYYEAVKKTGGMFISIWHNTFLGTSTLFKGWREEYENFLLSRT